MSYRQNTKQITLRSILGAVAFIALALASYNIGHDRATKRWFEQLPTAKFGDNGVLARIRLVAADTLEPVEGARFETILIGADGGDGGFHEYTSDEHGGIVLNQYLWPGRYQIFIDPPAISRYQVTQYSEQETYLVVREDGSYSPLEFKVAVKP